MAAPIFKDLDLSLRAHPVSKDVLKKTDVDAVKQSLKTLFQNGAFFIPFDPNSGIGFESILFEPLTPPLIGIFQRKISEKIFKYEPRCVIDSLSLVETEENGITIDLAFHVIGNTTQQKFVYTLARVR